jgi:hypothetical protein
MADEETRLIQEFQALTGSSAEQSRVYLQMNDWDVEVRGLKLYKY